MGAKGLMKLLSSFYHSPYLSFVLLPIRELSYTLLMFICVLIIKFTMANIHGLNDSSYSINNNNGGGYNQLGGPPPNIDPES